MDAIKDMKPYKADLSFLLLFSNSLVEPTCRKFKIRMQEKAKTSLRCQTSQIALAKFLAQFHTQKAYLNHSSCKALKTERQKRRRKEKEKKKKRKKKRERGKKEEKKKKKRERNNKQHQLEKLNKKQTNKQ